MYFVSVSDIADHKICSKHLQSRFRVVCRLKIFITTMCLQHILWSHVNELTVVLMFDHALLLTVTFNVFHVCNGSKCANFGMKIKRHLKIRLVQMMSG